MRWADYRGNQPKQQVPAGNRATTLAKLEAEAQMSAQPKVMTRPVIRDDNLFYLRWGEAVRKTLLPA